MTARLDLLASSSTPRATSVKNGFATSSTIRPIIRLRPARNCRADSFRTNPSALIDSCTRSRVEAATMSGRFSTLDTVPTDTPACAATSLMLMGAFTRPSSQVPTASVVALLGTCQVLPPQPTGFRRRWRNSCHHLGFRRPPHLGLKAGLIGAHGDPPRRAEPPPAVAGRDG